MIEFSALDHVAIVPNRSDDVSEGSFATEVIVVMASVILIAVFVMLTAARVCSAAAAV